MSDTEKMKYTFGSLLFYMVRTKEQIDHLNEFREEGQKLPYEHEGMEGFDNNNQNTSSPPEQTEEEKQAAINAQSEADKLKEQEEADKNKNTPAKVELTDDEKRQIAMQVLGVTDLSELVKKSEIKKEPTPEEIEKAKEQRESDKIAYALSKGIINKKQYEEFITDIKSPTDIVFAQYLAEQQAEDKDLTEDEIRAEFESKFGLDSNPDTRKHKRGLKEIGLLAENIIKAKHAAIFELDSKYSAYESEISSKEATEQKILSQAPVYKKDIEEVYAEIKKVPIKLSDTESFDVELDEKVLNRFKDQMLGNEYSTTQILSGYNKETIKEVAKNAAIIEDLPNILKKYGDEQVKRHQAGTRGIVPQKGGQKAGAEIELSENQKKALAFAFGEQSQVAN